MVMNIPGNVSYILVGTLDEELSLRGHEITTNEDYFQYRALGSIWTYVAVSTVAVISVALQSYLRNSLKLDTDTRQMNVTH